MSSSDVQTAASDEKKTWNLKNFKPKSMVQVKVLEDQDLYEYIEILHVIIKKLKRKLRKYKNEINKLTEDVNVLKASQKVYETEVQPGLNIQSKEDTEKENNEQSLDDRVAVHNAFSFINEMRQAAEEAQNISNFIYEPTSGLYYDQKSGYYYNAEYGLYYDGNTGCYYNFNKKNNCYEFHSQVQVQATTSSRKEDDNIEDVVFDEFGVVTDLETARRLRDENELQKREKERKLKNKSTKNKNRGKYREQKDPTSKTRKRSKKQKKSSGNDSENEKNDKNRSVEFEDGELTTSSSDSGSESDSDEEKLKASMFKGGGRLQDIAKKYPPSLRIVVQETNLEDLKVGSLSLITFMGGSLGREGNHDVIIPDVNVSKFHLKFTYDAKQSIYKCVDLGSRNGTILNGSRMSASKSESNLYDLVHGSIIQVSQTKLLCHVHEGNSTCGLCEPGLLIETQQMEIPHGCALTYKEQLKKIQKKYGLENQKFIAAKQNSTNSHIVAKGNNANCGNQNNKNTYQDRAATRRLKIGSSTHAEKTETASVYTEIPSNNKGFKMLSKLGWSKGESLGKTQDSGGLLEPINVDSNTGQQGLGCSAPGLIASSSDKRKLELLKKTKERYEASNITNLYDSNVKIVSGSPLQRSNDDNSPQIISTPYFPMNYPRDYGTEQILTCEADNCNVRLDFTDFQLGLSSTLEIFDSNGQMVDSYNGEHFRPPIIISSGKSLLLQFRGNGVTGCGFRAEVTFVSPKQKEDRLMPYTDCGGLVSGPGGAITMMNMIENNTDVRFFDCIWIIKPGNNYMMMKTHISLRIEEFHGMASRSDLTIRQGTTSDALEIENLVWPNNGVSKETHVVPVLTGYYIRLRGVFGMSSKLAIVYSVFNYLNCYIGSEFLCGNNHCISIRLHCDGFDHCGDGSDEPDSCEDDWANLQNDRKWYSHKPNYYFPKIEQYPDLKTATGIFIISTLGIFAVLSGWMVILYRMGVRARHQRELQNHLQTISELLDRQEEITSPDEPPSYEAPPDYEEVIKIGMDHEMREPRERHRKHHRRHRDCSRASSNATVSSTVPIHNCSDRPSTSAAAAMSVADESIAQTTVVLNEVKGNICQELSQHIIRSTQNCGITSASQAPETAPTKCRCNCQAEENKQKRLAASTVLENLSQTINSCNTTTQLEECSRDFCDDTLNISFSLGIPQTGAGLINDSNNIESASSRPKSSVNCTENTHLKKSWIVMNSGGQAYKVQRLRPTFSSPEAFLHDWSFYGDSQNYGSILPHEKSFILSNNTSNFISDLSRDPSANSIGTQNSNTKLKSTTHSTCSYYNNNNNSNNSSNITNETGITQYEEDTSSLPNTSAGVQRSSRDTQLLFMSEAESDDGGEQNISCFGTVNNPFKVNTKIKYTAVGRTHVRRRHARSRSFTNSKGNERSSNILRRSSSADLLLSLRPVNDIFYSDNRKVNLYWI